MKSFIPHISLSVLLLGAALLSSCGKLPSAENSAEQAHQNGKATVQIEIGSAPATKSAKDGDTMVNLRVWMVDGNGKVSQYASHTPNAVRDTVTFQDVVRGDYTLYFLANSTALSSYVAGSTIDNSFLKATLALPSSSSTYPIYSDTEGMPLSLMKTCNVGAGVNRISAEIVRVCGQINVTLKNRTTDKAIYVSGVSLSKRSPSLGYIFQQDDHSSPTGTTYGALQSSSALTRIEPGEESKMLSCCLFESCADVTDTLRLSVAGGLYEKDEYPTVTTVTKSSYKTTGSTTNTTISTSKYYFLASASSQRQFLCANNTTGALEIVDVGTDDELFVTDNITNYLWEFGSTGSTTTVKNVGKGTYINISFSGSGRNRTASYSLSSSSSLNTGTSTGRQFYNTYDYTNWRGSTTYYSYLYNNGGKIGVTSPSSSTSSVANTGWYLREATSYEYTAQALTPDPLDDFDRTKPLSYTDSYGIIQPLEKVCRNDKVEIIVNIFYNPHTSSFDFEVEPWTEKDNETTFD